VIPHLSMRPGLCLHPVKIFTGCGAYYPPALYIPRILVLALLLLGEPMSLYRATLRFARLLPLGVAMLPVSPLPTTSGFADVSPVFTLRLPAKATKLIEPASASPLPSGLHAYSVFNLTMSYPTGREDS
jgi:hypothetical protein